MHKLVLRIRVRGMLELRKKARDKHMSVLGSSEKGARLRLHESGATLTPSNHFPRCRKLRRSILLSEGVIRKKYLNYN